AISYTAGTALFNYDAALRGNLAIVLTSIALCSLYFLPKQKIAQKMTQEFSLLVMVLWIFLDSALFETLSRDTTISIWRDGYSTEIILFHIIGIVAALVYKIEKEQKTLFIIMLFALSYLFYFLQEGFILSLIYPFVISYYNVVILQTIVKKDLKIISVYMVFIGWIASGAGLFVALHGLILFVPVLFVLVLLNIFNSQQSQKKELHYA
ncbi:MAG: hypothetical protein WBG69_02070, partial [Arcobacteraceae bacterium]